MNVDLASLDTAPCPRYVAKAKEHGVIEHFLMDIIPNTVVGAFAEGEILQVLFFGDPVRLRAVRARRRAARPLLGAHRPGRARLLRHRRHRHEGWRRSGAFGAMAFTIGKYGVGTLLSLGHLMLALLRDLPHLHFRACSAPSPGSTGFSIFKFIRYIKEELLIVLGTSSSESVLPRMIAKMESARLRGVRGRPRDPDRLLVQPRRHLHLSHHGGAVPGAGDRTRT